MSNCTCHSANTSISGGQPLQIKDFTDSFMLHFNYSNWDEYQIFTCKHCGTIWFLESNFVDRPPYIGNASRITQQEINHLKSWEESDLNQLIEEKGIQSIRRVLDGTAQSGYFGQSAPKDES